MMERLREGVNSIWVKIILGLVILSFVFAGVGGGLLGGNANIVAKVGDAEIGRAEFEQAYQNERNMMQSRMGEYFTALLGDPAYVESFHRSILERMVNEVLLEQHAKQLGLRISDAQIQKLILEMPQFQKDGKFDKSSYQATLRRAGFSVDSFAEYLRNDLVRQQLLIAMQGSDFVLDTEIQRANALIMQTRDIQTVSINLQELADAIELNDEQIASYYNDNAQLFTRPEQQKVSYVELSAQQLKSTIEPADDEQQAYYKENLARFSTSEQRHLRHILIQEGGQKVAQSVLESLKSGADFAQLATEKSEDIGSAESGGDLGWVEKGVMVAEFEAAAFALQNSGDLSEIVETDFGYHIIKLEEVKLPQPRPFAEVQDAVKQELTQQLAVAEYYKQLTKLEKLAFENSNSLDAIYDELGLEIKVTDFISEIDAPQVLKATAVRKALQSEEVAFDGFNSEAIDIAPEHVIVVRVEEQRDEIVLPLEEVRDMVVSQLAMELATEQGQQLVADVIADLEQGNTTLLTENNLSFDEQQTIDRSGELANHVFAMKKPAEGPVYGSMESHDGLTIVKLLAVNDAVNDEYNQQVAQELLTANSQSELAGVLAQLRESIDVKYYLPSAN